MSTRTLKREILKILTHADFQKNLDTLRAMPARQAVNPLFSFLYNTNPIVKWHAVTAMGQVVSHLAYEDMESARVVLRRMIWNLNDESGGIGWGSPEAMGNTMANHAGLAQEYHRILVSYIRPDGNFLEHPELQKGLLWGLARLGWIYPDLVKNAGPFLIDFLTSQDPEHRGLAALATGNIREPSARKSLKNLTDDPSEIELYWDMTFSRIRVCELAEKALDLLNSNTEERVTTLLS